MYELLKTREILGQSLHTTESAIAEHRQGIRDILATNERPLPPEPLVLMGIHQAQLRVLREERGKLLGKIGTVKREINPSGLQWQQNWVR